MAISGRKAQGLVAILALLPGMAASRDRLAGLLWGDRADEQARNSLRQALVALKKELGDAGLDFLEAERDQVRLRADRVSVDAAEFEKLAHGRGECGQRPPPFMADRCWMASSCAMPPSRNGRRANGNGWPIWHLRFTNGSLRPQAGLSGWQRRAGFWHWTRCARSPIGR